MYTDLYTVNISAYSAAWHCKHGCVLCVTL